MIIYINEELCRPPLLYGEIVFEFHLKLKLII